MNKKFSRFKGWTVSSGPAAVTRWQSSPWRNRRGLWPARARDWPRSMRSGWDQSWPEDWTIRSMWTVFPTPWCTPRVGVRMDAWPWAQRTPVGPGKWSGVRGPCILPPSRVCPTPGAPTWRSEHSPKSSSAYASPGPLVFDCEIHKYDIVGPISSLKVLEIAVSQSVVLADNIIPHNYYTVFNNFNLFIHIVANLF